MRKKLVFLLTTLFFLFSSATRGVSAREGSVLGIHILNPAEALQAKELLKNDKNAEEWHYVTIPLSLNDLEKKDQWQNFFQFCKENKIIPVVRLVTKFENGAWKVPNKKDVVDLFTFLSDLDWPSDKRYVIVFNEVNHISEWGGRTDPAEYARILRFSSNWARAEAKNYQVLPAAMDLAAPNGPTTMEAFTYLDRMRAADPEIFSYITYWNSHSYPNPAFSSSPEKTGKNSVRGFIHELEYLKRVTGRDFQTFITETGWVENAATRRWLPSYYEYTAQHVWSDPRVMAVTPFVLQGDPGPFSGFTFLNKDNQPTIQYQAYRNVIEKEAKN